MTIISANQIINAARQATQDEPHDERDRLGLLVAKLCGMLSDSECDRLAEAIGMNHLSNAGSRELFARVRNDNAKSWLELAQ